MRDALALLLLLSERIPQNGNAHGLVVLPEGKLGVALGVGRSWRVFTLDDADLDASVETVVDAIVALALPAEGEPEAATGPTVVAF